jgi:hypothetical protein
VTVKCCSRVGFARGGIMGSTGGHDLGTSPAASRLRDNITGEERAHAGQRLRRDRPCFGLVR